MFVGALWILTPVTGCEALLWVEGIYEGWVSFNK